MKEKKKQESREPVSQEMLLRRNPVPFGDVRKYYYVGIIGTTVLLAVCFYICFAAIVLRTDSCVQIPNGVIVVLLLCALLSIAGHYSRTLAGYGLSAVTCLVIVLVLQFYNGGIMLKSNLPDYGEVVREGIKGIDFWILLVKAMAVVHMLLSVVFINSTMKVKEEPPVKGMNIKIQKLREWFAKKDTVTSLGWRPTEFWIACICLILWMLVAQANPFITNKYDHIAMLSILLGSVLVFIGKAYFGALCFMEGFLTCGAMYQLRFGWSVPTAGAYIGVWLAFIFIVLEAFKRRKAAKNKTWDIRIGTHFGIQISVEPQEEVDNKWDLGLRKISEFCAVVVVFSMLPIHEFLSSFSGSYMNQAKDNLPYYFFLPLVMLVCAWGGTAMGYFCSAVISILLYDSLQEVSTKFTEMFRFDSIEQHGKIGEVLTERMNRYVFWIECLILFYFVVCVITAVMIARRRYGRAETTETTEMG